MNGAAVLRWTARRLPGVPADMRDDVVEAIDEVSDRAPCVDCALEVGSLVGFALRTASRRGAADDRHEMIRQGAWVGALVLAIAAALLSWAGVHDRGDVVVAILATVVAVVIAGGHRPSAIGASVAAVAASVGTDGELALTLIILVGVVWGRPYDARPCRGGACLAAAATLGGGAIAALLPTAGAGNALIVAATTLPIVLLAVGWFDPRFAVAATVVWFWRFAEVDVGELVAAFGALGDQVAPRLALLRSLAMGAGVLVAWHVADAAMQRALTVFRRR